MKRVVKIIDQDNNEEKYEVLCTFESGMTNKNYVIYSGYHEDKEGKLLVLRKKTVDDRKECILPGGKREQGDGKEKVVERKKRTAVMRKV